MKEKKNAFLEQARIGITPCLLDKTAPSDSPAVSCFFFLLTTSISVKEKLTLLFYTNEYS